ncbi:MAG: type III-A CRISPR-associated RAMP protein Csm3 [Candidatus Anstonellales archaeon]
MGFETKVLKGEITVLSGLHIGGEGTYEIAGIDNPVIKDPEGYPYIPGSSLKGKIRCLYEKLIGIKYNEKGKIITGGKEKDEIELLFGSPEKQGILIFRDSFVSREQKNRDPNDFIEVKIENRIDRDTGKAKDLRSSERVKPGTKFDFELVVILEKNDGKYITPPSELKNKIEKMVELLNSNYLGGSGTRGYGKVKLEINNLDELNKI